jgi:hypothetical protein
MVGIVVLVGSLGGKQEHFLSIIGGGWDELAKLCEILIRMSSLVLESSIWISFAALDFHPPSLWRV